MLKRLKQTFFGRKCMSEKDKRSLANYLVCEYKVDPISAKSLVETGEYKMLMEAYK